MACRELGMVELREVLRRWMSGEGLRAIARATGVDRKTIAEYVRAALAVGVARGGALPTDEQLAAILTARRPGRPSNTAAPSPELERLRPHAAAVRQWLGEGLRLTKIYRRLRAQGWPSPTARCIASRARPAVKALRGQAARLRAGYQAVLERVAPLHHRAARLDEEARALKGILTDCELQELRRAWSGV